MFRSMIATSMFIALGAGGALAQNDVCIDPNTRQIDQQGTEAWQYIAQNTDPSLVQALTGTWYTEVVAANTGQIDYQYNIYEANGLFQYRSRVCSGSACNDYDGHGFFAVMPTGDGTMTTMLIVSDLNRDRQCSGGSSRFLDANTMQTSTGQVWQRVQ